MNSSQLEEVMSASDEEVKSILSTILNMNMWNENSEKVVISAINKLLSVSKSRLQGLEFLNLIINNCSTRIISENGINWISYCLVKYPADDLKELKLATIGRIVENCFEEQEFSKGFISDHISKVSDMCISTHNNNYETEAALETLSTCMKHYGSWFTQHKIRIENFILSFLENRSEQVVDSAAVAFHYLQQVGGAGTDGINHKTNFTTNFHKLCATVQKLFDKLFENETEIDQSDRSNEEVFEFTDLPHYTQKMLNISVRRIKNCLNFIMTMLLKGFPAEKEIRPSDVLDLITRGTAIHRCFSSEEKISVDDCQYSILLSQVQIELLRLLHVLIIWLHANALPFTFTITKILIDCLNKCQQCTCFKTDSIYQEMVYKVLGSWIRIAKGAVHTHFQTELVKCILKDITPLKNNVTLNLQTDALKNKSKKALQKAVQERIIIASGQNNNPNKALTNVEKLNKENNCLFALDTLKHLLIGVILKLQPNVVQELYASIINTLVEIQTSKESHPYTNPGCQAKLYEVLVAFYEQDTLKVLPPLQLTIDILNRGINNRNRVIASTCENGLSMIEKLCQPVCPSLFISEDTATGVGERDKLSLIYGNTTQDKEGNSSLEDSSKTEEINMETLNISTSEVSTVEDNLRSQDSEEYSLEPVPSVHIIDVQVVRQSSENVEEEEKAVLEEPVNYQQDANVDEVEIKSEVLSQISMENIKVDDKPEKNGEPPSKKIRVENQKEDGDTTVEMEKPYQSPDDDEFVDGCDFVDAVKEY